MRIPNELTEARDSLSKNNAWGGPLEMPEDVLAPNDWRLDVILKFRKLSNENELNKQKNAENQIRQYLIDNGITDQYDQAYILRRIGLVQVEILNVTNLGKNDYYNHVGILFRAKKNYGRTGILDAEMILKQMNLNKLLEER